MDVARWFWRELRIVSLERGLVGNVTVGTSQIQRQMNGMLLLEWKTEGVRDT